MLLEQLRFATADAAAYLEEHPPPQHRMLHRLALPCRAVARRAPMPCHALRGRVGSGSEGMRTIAGDTDYRHGIQWARENFGMSSAVCRQERPS